MDRRVSVAELIDSDVPLRPEEAAAIVRDVCRQYAGGELRGIPNATVIRLTHDGVVLVEGPVSRDQSAVPAAAALLSELLPSFSSANGFRVPGGLRLVLARAAGALDVPPFASMDEFRAALDRFAAPDLTAVVRELYRSWAARQCDRACGPSKELTISDVRRARRATGLSLEDVSRTAGIPADRLRELEWGFVRSWHADAQGRDELRRYARAAGLDEDLVVSVAWPLLESEDIVEGTVEEAPGGDAAWALVPAAPQVLTTSARPANRHRDLLMRYRWAIALAAAVLIAVGAVSSELERTPPSATAIADVPASRVQASSDVRLASYTTTTAKPEPEPESIDRPVARRPRVRKAAPSPPPSKPSRPAKQSFFKKELFRITIR